METNPGCMVNCLYKTKADKGSGLLHVDLI